MAASPRRPRRAITGRAIVLGTLVVLLLVLLASPLNRFFASRSSLSDAAQQYRHDKQKLAVLNAQVARWGDPGFIQQQARERLQYAMPGDTVYVVVDHGQKNDLQKTSGNRLATDESGSWNGKLWNSIAAADAGN